MRRTTLPFVDDKEFSVRPPPPPEFLGGGHLHIPRCSSALEQQNAEDRATISTEVHQAPIDGPCASNSQLAVPPPKTHNAFSLSVFREPPTDIIRPVQRHSIVQSTQLHQGRSASDSISTFASSRSGDQIANPIVLQRGVCFYFRVKDEWVLCDVELTDKYFTIVPKEDDVEPVAVRLSRIEEIRVLDYSRYLEPFTMEVIVASTINGTCRGLGGRETAHLQRSASNHALPPPLSSPHSTPKVDQLNVCGAPSGGASSSNNSEKIEGACKVSVFTLKAPSLAALQLWAEVLEEGYTAGAGGVDNTLCPPPGYPSLEVQQDARKATPALRLPLRRIPT